MKSSSLFDYQPGELSLLLNPTSEPDIYQPLPRPASTSKRALEDADHKAQQQRPSKRAKTHSHPTTPAPPSSQLPPSLTKRKTGKAVKASEDGDEKDEGDEGEGEGEQEAAEGDAEEAESDEEEGDGEDEELSDLEEELDDSALYDDLDPATARQLKREKRLKEDEESERLPSSSAKRRSTSSPSYAPAADPRLPRTLFVGNVPVTCSRKALMRRFAEFGSIESCRFRSFAVDNPKLPKKAAIIRHAFHPQRQSMNAYIVYEQEEAVARAVTANGCTFMEHVLRVDYADRSKDAASAVPASPAAPPLSHPRRTLFVGNLPFSASEQALHSTFSPAGPVEYVRLIRDPLMNVGKGFGFVVFVEEAAVKRALAMRGVALEGRQLRISRGMDEEKLNKVREARERERMKEEGLVGAARRMAGKEKHAKRKAAETAKAGQAQQMKPGGAAQSYGGEKSNPLEWVRQQRRLLKKQTKRKDERKRKHSLVKIKPTAPLTRRDSKAGAAQSKATERAKSG